MAVFSIGWWVLFLASYLTGISIEFSGVEWAILFIAIVVLTIGLTLSFFIKWTKLKPFKLLAILGIAISMLMYVSTIWIGDFAVNPKTQNVGIWIKHNLPSFVYLNEHQYLLDTILFLGFILALIGTFFIYKEKGKVFSFEKTLYIYSTFIAIMIFFTVDVTKWLATSLFGVDVAITGFPSWNYGFPTWTYQVTTATSFLKYSDFTLGNPNVYFLNYWQLFVICICIALITKVLIKKQNNIHPQPKNILSKITKLLSRLKGY